MPADDLIELEQVQRMLLEPGRKPLVKDGPGPLWEALVRTVRTPPSREEHIGAVTDRLQARSTDVIETPSAPGTTRSETAWERFEALYRSSRDDVYSYVATLLRDRTAAEDVTALAFERAYRRRRTFDRRRGEERAWLFGIARNAALDELRRRRRVAQLAADPEDTTVTELDERDVALRRTAVREALAQLSGREREIVALKFHGGLSNAELARVLGVSESNAGTLLYRTMEKLRKACDATS
jgi:RNA polymerase sigma-70 factor, ECF subfamily